MTMAVQHFLTEDDFRLVYKAVRGASTSWRRIGIELEFAPQELNDLERQHHYDNDRCLQAIVERWLKRRNMKPTWGQLVVALREETVGEEGIAADIELKYLLPGAANGHSPGGIAEDIERKLFDRNVDEGSEEGGTPQESWCRQLQKGHTYRGIAVILVLLSAIVLVAALLYGLPNSTKGFGGESHDQSYGPKTCDDCFLDHPASCHDEVTKAIGDNNLPHLAGPFLGRDEDVTDITNTLLGKGRPWVKVVGIYGLPAIGKTSLAVHVGYEIAHQGVAVRYINLNDAYLKFLYDEEQTCYDGSDIHTMAHGNNDIGKFEHNVENIVYFSSEEQKHVRVTPLGLLEWAKSLKNQTLLILDNCDHLMDSDADINRFREKVNSLSQASGFLRLITTSRHKLSLVDGFQGYPLRNLSDEAAVQVLQERSPLSHDQARTISKLLGNHPLALNIIAGLLGEVPVGIVTAQLEEDPLSTKAHHSLLFFSQTIHRVLSLSYKYLDEDNRNCSYYLTIFPGSFSETAVAAILGLFTDTSVCLKRLEDLSLIDHYWYAYDSRYQLHRLIKEFFKRPSEPFELPPLHDAVRCSFGLYYSQRLLEFVRSYISNDSETLGRFEYEGHNFRELVGVVAKPSPDGYCVAKFHPKMAEALEEAISHDLNNLLLETLIFTQEDLSEMLRFSLFEKLRVSQTTTVSPVYRTIRYPGQSIPSMQCVTSSVKDVSSSQCCQLCSWAFPNVSCHFCKCVSRQPSTKWYPVHAIPRTSSADPSTGKERDLSHRPVQFSECLLVLLMICVCFLAIYMLSARTKISLVYCVFGIMVSVLVTFALMIQSLYKNTLLLFIPFCFLLLSYAVVLSVVSRINFDSHLNKFLGSFLAFTYLGFIYIITNVFGKMFIDMLSELDEPSECDTVVFYFHVL